MKASAIVQRIKQMSHDDRFVARRGLHRPLTGSAKIKFLFAALLLSVPASLALATGQNGSAGQAMNLHHDDIMQPQSESKSIVTPSTSSSSSTVTLHATAGSTGGGGSSAEHQDSTSTTGQPSSNVNLEVNGRHIDVPSNGSVHKSFTSNNGQSTIDISVDNQQSSTTSSSNQTTFTIDQQSDSTVTSEP